jgi:hypothetical protein
VRFVNEDELEAIEADEDLVDALEELGRALKEVGRAGEEIGFHWRDHARMPGNQPDDLVTAWNGGRARLGPSSRRHLEAGKPRPRN